MRIWKVKLEVTSVQIITLPDNADLLDAQFQSGVLYLWAAILPDQPLKERRIFILETGETFTQAYKYICTVQQGSLALHIMEELSSIESNAEEAK
jgi:hypothetical protein